MMLILGPDLVLFDWGLVVICRLYGPSALDPLSHITLLRVRTAIVSSTT